MHVLHLILMCLTIDKVTGQSKDICLEDYGTWDQKGTIYKSEYENLEIVNVRYIKSECQSLPYKIIWKKDNNEVKREFKKRNRKLFKSILKFNSLSKTDSGNYTLNFSNSKFQYIFAIELIVNDGTTQLRTIRENTIPPNRIDLLEGRIYWMPKMIDVKKFETVPKYSNFSISCWFTSTKYVSDTLVSWYQTRSLTQYDDEEERIQINSRIQTEFLEVPCYLDTWMPTFKVHCYETRLLFFPFISTDTGTYKCTVGQSLQTSIQLLEEVTNFDIQPQRVNLRFNNNDTVCVGSNYVLQCFSKLNNHNLSLWFKNVSNISVILTSKYFWDVLYQINSTRLSDTGEYICRQNMNHEEHMFLTVKICPTKLYPYMWFLFGLLLIPMFLVTIQMYSHIVKSRQRFYLSNKIHSITQLNADGLHRNERYIPLIQDLHWEISRKYITVSSEILGAGEFGTVYRGKHRNQPVAVKVANVNGNEALMQEINVMKQLGYHQNIIQLIGVCSWNEPLMAVIELAIRGNLRQYLRDHNPILNGRCEQIGMEQLLLYVTQIATGMEYLASKNVIHRDLAARNCLLTSDACVKLSDFGLTRVAVNYYSNYSQEAKPIAWVAPEAISGHIFTSKSDVWSFGIVMWEVFELGASPYPTMSSSQIIEAVLQGTVNSKPALASDAIYGIMTRCWSLEPNDRPCFKELREHLYEVDVNEYL